MSYKQITGAPAELIFDGVTYIRIGLFPTKSRKKIEEAAEFNRRVNRRSTRVVKALEGYWLYQGPRL